MLLRLQIQNFALIQNLSLEFDGRLNVLTGETGAGKSILIDALCFALGERFDGQKPQPGKTCSVEAVFEIPKILLKQPALEPFLSEEEMLVLRREVTAEGKTRAWINNRTAANAALKECGDLLVNIHGQHDHQLLLNPASHLDLVDLLAKSTAAREEYEELFAQYDALVKQKRELLDLQETREREIDLLKYQIKEIEGPEFEAEEEDGLKHERIRMANAEKLYEMAGRVLQLLNDEEASVSNLLGRSARDLNTLVKLDASMEPLKGDFENAQLGIEEVIRALRDYQENLSFDSDRLEEIDQRLDRIELVKRKYGGSLGAALNYLKEAQEKYDKLLNSAVYEKDIETQMARILPKMKKLAAELTEKRSKAGQALKRTIEAELKDLNIPQAVFECRIHSKEFASDGADQLEFLISLNPGQAVMPLAKIISGGESSRVMLAIKKALMNVDPVPTLIFDEIDANIGGRLGNVTGEKLKEISEERQVLLITHLPQIASFADRHFKVSKTSLRGQTAVDYQIIEGEERVRELAQMMSGKKETDISKKHAEEMLKATR
jgi:DNA repair protein RecN (Recombination protein N)